MDVSNQNRRTHRGKRNQSFLLDVGPFISSLATSRCTLEGFWLFLSPSVQNSWPLGVKTLEMKHKDFLETNWKQMKNSFQHMNELMVDFSMVRSGLNASYHHCSVTFLVLLQSEDHIRRARVPESWRGAQSLPHCTVSTKWSPEHLHLSHLQLSHLSK